VQLFDYFNFDEEDFNFDEEELPEDAFPITYANIASQQQKDPLVNESYQYK
jgi:hypothetical protein